MKAGNLVRMNEEDYPKYKGKLGVLIRERLNNSNQFVVNVDGKNHSFFIHKTSIEVIKEAK